MLLRNEPNYTNELAFALLHSILQGQIYLLLQVFLDVLLLHSSPLWWKAHLFWVLVLKSFVGVHRTIQLQLLQRYWLGHRLGLLWYWMVCCENKQIILSFLRLHPSTAFWTLVDHDGYFISSKGWTSPDGQHRNQIDYILCSQRWRSSIQSAKTNPRADCGSDHELLIAKFRLKLKKIGKTTRPFRYDPNQIP